MTVHDTSVVLNRVKATGGVHCEKVTMRKRGKGEC